MKHITNERIYLHYYFIIVMNNENYSFCCLSNNRSRDIFKILKNFSFLRIFLIFIVNLSNKLTTSLQLKKNQQIPSKRIEKSLSLSCLRIVLE